MKSKCDNCNWTGEPLFELHEIEDLLERIDPGGIVPSGECPKCDCLCYPDTPEQRLRDAGPDLLAVLTDVRDWLNTHLRRGAINAGTANRDGDLVTQIESVIRQATTP